MNKILTSYFKWAPSLEKNSEKKETSGHVAKTKVLKNQETGKRQRSDSKKHKYRKRMIVCNIKTWNTKIGWKGEKGNIQKDPSY